MWIHWPFFPKTWTKGHWPLDDLWPHVCWGHMCDSTQGSLCPSPMTIHQCMWIQWSILQNTTYIHTHTTYILHTTYRMSDHIVSYWTQFSETKRWGLWNRHWPCMERVGVCAFVKRVNRGYTLTQCRSTGNVPIVGDIPSSKKALKLSRGDVLTPYVLEFIVRPRGVYSHLQTSFTPRMFSDMQLGIHNLCISGKLGIYQSLHIYNMQIPSCIYSYTLFMGIHIPMSQVGVGVCGCVLQNVKGWQLDTFSP